MQIALYRINVFKEMGSCKCIGKTPELNGTAKEIQDHFQKNKKNEDSKSFKEGYIDGMNLYFKVVEMSNSIQHAGSFFLIKKSKITLSLVNKLTGHRFHIIMKVSNQR
jgi:hypothetical protein